MLFQRSDYNRLPTMCLLWRFPELPFLVVDACQPKSTAYEVAKVATCPP